MVVKKYKLLTFPETKQLISAQRPILFKDKLSVFDENGKRIGRFSISVDQEEEHQDKTVRLIFVHISNRAYINGRLSESTVTGTLTSSLKTMEEIRYECTDVSESGKHERCFFLLRERTNYFVSVTNTICDVTDSAHTTISFSESVGLIGESTNVVLLRNMAQLGLEGILCLKTILSNGKQCKNYYVSKLSQQIVNGRRMQVLIVYRTITNHKKCNVTMTLALTRAGQIIYLFWSNSKCFLHIDPDAEIYTNAVNSEESRLEHHWHKDIQLHSLYLDEVELQGILSRSFKHRKDQLKRLLGDFIEHILFMKPEDPICYAIRYFSSLSPDMKICKERKKYSEVFERYPAGEAFGECIGEYFPFWLGEGGYYWNLNYKTEN